MMLAELKPAAEKLRVTAAGAGRIDGTVGSRIFLGSHWLFQVACDLGAVLVYQQNQGGPVPDEGASVGLDWHAGALRVLDAEDGARA